MPPESVQIGEWTIDTSQYVPVTRRVISMHCPHCGARHHRTESQRVNAFVG
jgi:ribosomal protein L44E